ncbi:PAS domain S-box protein [Methanobacterium formicicum]|uniref:Signal transduction histidine kinase n=1 Tax=Methanobacterium formicicum (strain DSM 3637 / PP1) TaxID=1204725 RepID=K2QCJ8_METFP|nr:PAS domain S-box protein [Methanobacterium formicicum]EKF85736.1 signal transduction histidine kinase [Methanobacterium formicicum DSM 3637]
MANILLVEDEMVEAMNIKISLQSMGYDVVAIASYGEEAVEKAQNLKPDLILMDIILKGSMDGIAVANAISKLGIPVIYITALPDDSTVNRALLSAPYGYLIKPFNTRKLKISIEVALYKKQMENKLKQSQDNYYQTIFENTSSATIIIEENKLISLVNMEFSTLTGYLKEEIEGRMKWTDFFAPEDRLQMEEYHNLRRINPDHAPRNYEAKLLASDGAIRYVYLTVAMLPGNQKSMMSILDMTELRVSKKAIEESREKFKSIFENAAEAIILFNCQGIIIESNYKIEEIFGFKKEEIIGQNFMNIVSMMGMDYNPAKIVFNHLISGNELKQIEWTIQNKSGKEVIFRVRPSIIKDKNTINGILLIMEDITELKTVENSLKNSLEEKEILLREIHHRVKNNLQIISSLLSLQRIQVEDKQTADILWECQGRVRTMAMIHENLYRSQDIGYINFRNYVETLLYDIFNSYHVDKGSINLNTQIESLKMDIETAMPCGLIINELATNSIKHAFPDRNGTIKIDLKSDGEFYILSFADDGIGLPEDANPKKSKKLGLMVVKTLVNQLNGLMEIERGNGTKFTIKFRELPYKTRI